ncbi:hypothetical protein V1282_000169 [Nitrobacteraceae bacterium AZCC 2146]
MRAGAEIRQILAALLLVAVAIDVVGAQIVMRHPGQRHGVVPAGESLQHEARGQKILAGPAVLLGNGDAEEAIVADLGKRRFRPPLVPVHSLAERIKLLMGEAVSLIEDCLLLLVKTERGYAIVAARSSMTCAHARSLSALVPAA